MSMEKTIKSVTIAFVVFMMVCFGAIVYDIQSRQHTHFVKDGMLFSTDEIEGTWVPDAPVIFAKGSDGTRVSYIVPSNYFPEEKESNYSYTMRMTEVNGNIDIPVVKKDTWYETTVTGQSLSEIANCYQIVATNVTSGNESLQAFGGIGCYGS